LAQGLGVVMARVVMGTVGAEVRALVATGVAAVEERAQALARCTGTARKAPH